MQSKTELIQAIAEQHSDKLTRQDVKGVLESLASVAYKELRKSGEFVVPGLAKLIRQRNKQRLPSRCFIQQRVADVEENPFAVGEKIHAAKHRAEVIERQDAKLELERYLEFFKHEATKSTKKEN